MSLESSLRSPSVRALRTLLALAVLTGQGCGWTPWARERAVADTYYPAETARMPAPVAPARRLRVRAYVEDEHARLTIGWQKRFADTLDRASEVLAPDLGIELVLTDARPWPEHPHQADLEAELQNLEALDPAADVDLVVGLASALPVVTASMHRLGVARVRGHHLVVRGMDDASEFAAIAQAFGLLSEEERARLYRARLHHKELTLLLHEVGHALGAEHETESDAIMAAEYTPRAVRFGAENIRAMRAELARRTGLPRATAEIAATVAPTPLLRAPAAAMPAAAMPAAAMPAAAMPAAAMPAAETPAAETPAAQPPAPAVHGAGAATIHRGPQASAGVDSARAPARRDDALDACTRLVETHAFAKAEAACRRAIDADLKAARPRFLLGLSELARGALRPAIAHLEQARIRAPDDEQIREALIAAHLAAGEAAEARALEVPRR